MKPEYAVSRPEDLDGIARELLAEASVRTVVLLDGPMGAGKTEFVKRLAKAAGIGDVSSPTFAIHHAYEGPNDFRMDHFDLYRIEGDADLDSTGFWDLFSEPQGLIVIEWSKRTEWRAWPPGWKVIALEFEVSSDGARRKIKIKS